jgi:hypothetical protein
MSDACCKERHVMTGSVIQLNPIAAYHGMCGALELESMTAVMRGVSGTVPLCVPLVVVMSVTSHTVLHRTRSHLIPQFDTILAADVQFMLSTVSSLRLGVLQAIRTPALRCWYCPYQIQYFESSHLEPHRPQAAACGDGSLGSGVCCCTAHVQRCRPRRI